MAIINFDIPGDAKFPLNALYGKPQDRNEGGQFFFSYEDLNAYYQYK